jgi:hypothetical protein
MIWKARMAATAKKAVLPVPTPGEKPNATWTIAAYRETGRKL